MSLIALVRYDISFKKSSERKTRGSEKWVIDYIVQYLLRAIILWKNWCLKERIFGPIKAQNWLLLLNQPHKDYLCEIYPLFSVSQLAPIHKTSFTIFSGICCLIAFVYITVSTKISVNFVNHFIINKYFFNTSVIIM